MNGLKSKALSIGLGGIAASLLIAGGQANAGICPNSATVMTVTGAGFSCTLGDSTFSGFSISGVNPTTTVVEFAAASPTMDVVTLSRDGGTFAPGTVVINFMVAEAADHVIEEASVGIDVGTFFKPGVQTTTRFNGVATMPASPLTNSQGGFVMFSPGVSSVAANNSSAIPGGAVVSSLTDVFSEIPEAAVPEPASLSLFGLGLLGLGFARRRRS